MSTEESTSLLQDEKSKSINAEQSTPATPANPVDFQTVLNEFRQNFGLSTIFTALVCVGTLAIIFGLAPGLLLAPRPQRLDFPLNPNEQRLLSYSSGVWTHNVTIWNSKQGIFSSVFASMNQMNFLEEARMFWDDEDLALFNLGDQEDGGASFTNATFYMTSVVPPLISSALNVSAMNPIFINSTSSPNVSVRANVTYTFSLLKGSRITFNYSTSNGTDMFVVKGYPSWLEFSDSTPSGSFFKRLNSTNGTFTYDVSVSDTYYFYLRAGGVPTRQPISGNTSIAVSYALYNTTGLKKLNESTQILTTKDKGGFILACGPQMLDEVSSVSYRVWPRYALFFAIFGSAMGVFIVLPTIVLGVLSIVYMVFQCIKKRKEKMMV